MPEDEEAAAQPARTPCAACKTLRRRCVSGCVFAPYFPADDDESRFAAVHRIFGASNVTRLLRDVELPDDRRRAAETLVEEAQARVRDPAFGCVSFHGILLALNENARAQVEAVREEIAREVGAAAAAETVDVGAAAPEEKVEARGMVELALADARKQDAELLAQRRAFDLEWLQRHRQAAAAKRAGEGRRVHGGRGQEDMDAIKQMNTGESWSEKNVNVKPEIPEEHVQRQLQAAAAADAEEEEEALASSEKAAAAQLQRHGLQSSVLDVAAAEELAKKLDAMIQKSATVAQQHDDPAAARYASLGLHVTPGHQQIAEAAAEQGMLRHKQYDVNDDTEFDVALGHGHPEQTTEAQLVAAAFAAGEVPVAMPPPLFAAELVRQEMMMQQYAQTELDVTLGHVQQQLAAAAPLAREEGVTPELAAAEIAREQALIIHNAAAAELTRDQEITLLLEAAAAAQYTDTELYVSPGHHRPPVYQMLQGQQLSEAGAVQVAMEPNTTTMQQQGQEHGCAAAAFQPPGSAVGQQPPPQGHTARAVGLQLNSSLLPVLGQTTVQATQQQQQSTDGGEHDSGSTAILYYWQA